MIPTGKVVRGCGVRKSDGAYIVCPLGTGPNAKPIEDFLIDPPIPSELYGLDATMLANKTTIWQAPKEMWPTLEAQGLQPDAWHLLDWVGESNYPHTADFIEEARSYGLSRRIPTFGLELEKIGPNSKLILIHPRAYNSKWLDQAQPLVCMKGKDGHAQLSHGWETPRGPCLFKTYDLIPAADGVPQMTKEGAPDINEITGQPIFQRTLGSTTYRYTPTGESRLGLIPGVFMSIRPAYISMIALENGELGEKCTRLKERLDRSGNIEYKIMDE